MRILFGVFDWGLGHATRDIPLIEKLLERKDKVDIISTGRALKVLRLHFKDKCTYFDVPSIYSPYTKTRFFALSFLFSVPRMIRSLNRAKKISKEIIKQGNYDKVISDCRYDVYDLIDNSYFINHQLRFKSPPIARGVIESALASMMAHYKCIIVPDFPSKNLTQELSHNLKFIKKSKIKYIGIISHIKKRNVKKDIDYFISLSGPEPQRTILEKKLLKSINLLKGNIIIAGGNPDIQQEEILTNVQMHSFLDSKSQEDHMNRAKFIITRPGYTTIMELAELDKKNVLLIPTPGQTEQEYLGDLYEEKKYFYHQDQHALNLVEDIEKSKTYKGFKPPWKTKESISKFLKIIEE